MTTACEDAIATEAEARHVYGADAKKDRNGNWQQLRCAGA